MNKSGAIAAVTTVTASTASSAGTAANTSSVVTADRGNSAACDRNGATITTSAAVTTVTTSAGTAAATAASSTTALVRWTCDRATGSPAAINTILASIAISASATTNTGRIYTTGGVQNTAVDLDGTCISTSGAILASQATGTPGTSGTATVYFSERTETRGTSNTVITLCGRFR